MYQCFRNDGDGAPDYLAIYGPIGEDFWSGEGVTAKDVLQALDARKGQAALRVRINSMGGDVGDGMAIYNALKSFGQAGAEVTTEVEGYALSSAATITMSGKRIKIHENSVMMIHPPSVFAMGDSDDLRKQADILDTLQAQIAGVYASRTGKSLDEINKLMDAETWMTAQEAKDMGFADELIPNVTPTPGQPDENPDGDPEHSGFNRLSPLALCRNFGNAPAWVKARLRAQPPASHWRRNLARRRLELLTRVGE